jgi:protein-tyrosine phosphatase
MSCVEPSGNSMKHVLFLCSGNYFRSRFAEELFNFHSEKAHLNWRASSRALAIERGSENVGSLSPFTIEALKARNIFPAGLASFPLACRSEDFETAGLVIAMKEAEHHPLITERFPGWQNRVTYWHVHDIDAAGPAEAIDMIDRLVSDLIVSMTSGEN